MGFHQVNNVIFEFDHKQIESGKNRTDDFYNIQHLNSFHSHLKL